MPPSLESPAQNLDAGQVAVLLRELGQRIELSGDSPFKARAYFRAADALLATTERLSDLVNAKRLREMPGVGAAIAEKIETMHRSGTHPTLERMRADLPASALEVLEIPGLSAQKARQIVQDLGILSIDALQDAASRDALAAVRGLGPALQAKIMQGIEMRRRSRGQRLLHHAGELLDAAAANLARSHPALDRITPAGDFRRGCDLVHELRLAAKAGEAGSSIAEVTLGEIDLTVAGPECFGVALLLATGSRDHVAQLQARARDLGLTLDQSGLRSADAQIACPEEADVYAALGLPFIPPELREGTDEIECAAAGRVPDLVESGDLRGILHAHTTRSDGGNTLEEMAEAARLRGYVYFGVADHSRSAGYAGGLSLEEVEAQHAEAETLNRRYRGRFRILKGIESDILADGSLDYPDEVLRRFDFVVASVHSRFRMDEEAQTERILAAVRNPHTTILGHMTGRLLLRREGYALDVERVLRACAEHAVAVEINANPHRLDLDWRWHRRALDLGCMVSINPDAHTTAEIDLIRWGVLVARKGGVPKDRVLNALDLKAIKAFFDQKRSSRLT